MEVDLNNFGVGLNLVEVGLNIFEVGPHIFEFIEAHCVGKAFLF